MEMRMAPNERKWGLDKSIFSLENTKYFVLQVFELPIRGGGNVCVEKKLEKIIQN